MRAWIWRIAATCGLVAVVAAGVLWWKQPPAKQAAPQAPPPPEVGVIEMQTANVPLPLEFSGRVSSFRAVEIRAQVSGMLQKREFEEGAIVKAGEVLFRIDPRTYEAALSRASAQAAQAQATLVQAEENFKRVEELASQKVSTQKNARRCHRCPRPGAGGVQSTEADMLTARLNLEFTTVKAPVTGPTSLVSPPEGTLIQAQQTVLTTITQLDPAYVNFTFTDAEMRQLREMNARRRAVRPRDLTVELQFGDGAVYPQPGKVDMRSRTIDPRTGTIQIRAIFPNRDGALLPGQFVRVNLTGIVLPNAIVVPKAAISQGPQGAFVYVIERHGGARAPGPARPRARQRLDRAQGAEGGDRIIVDGVIRVRPGMP